MSVTSVTNTVDTTGTTASTSGSATQLLDTNAFMNLLVTQLQYQDPLNPSDANQFMSQLAQLTSVERLQNIYDSLTKLETTTQTGNFLDMIGKKIQVDGNKLSTGDEFTVKPSADYDSVVFTVTNLSDGSVSKVARSKGESLTYTNEGADNVAVSAAAYSNGAAVTSTTATYRLVAAVKSSGSTVTLVAGNGDEYAASSIKTIKN